MSGHTPGPWEMPFGPAERRVSDIFEAGDYYICPPLGEIGPVAIASGDENARLIAAAPEMFQLLRDLINLEGPQPGNSAWGDRVMDMIAKVTGDAA
jgi:hypothetical protein